ncbi:MAG: hypothetical protein HY875_09370 [Chloroflexi bacterium]|nr:hypothetical protein [Chloroflexota bacterium]
MTFPPFAVARYGVYVAVAIAAISVWLGHQAGASLDWAVMRAVFFFVIVAALGFAAEAVLTVGYQPRPRRAANPSTDQETHDA